MLGPSVRSSGEQITHANNTLREVHEATTAGLLVHGWYTLIECPYMGVSRGVEDS